MTKHRNHINIDSIVILFILIWPNVSTETFISQQITACPRNVKDQVIVSFAGTGDDRTVTVTDHHFYVNDTNDLKEVVLNETLANPSSFIFNVTIGADLTLQINGTFAKVCESSSNSTSTVIIAFLASLCLILLTALALTLIILRRKKPITFKFGQKEDDDYEGRGYSTNFDDNDNSSSKSSSLDVTNNSVATVPKISGNNSPRPPQPRKSSLKPPKTSLADQLNNNNNSAFENGAFNGTELEVVDEVNEDLKADQKINFDETRRKSIVTFSDQTDVNYG